MNNEPSPTPEKEDRIATLVRTLREVERELQALTGGQLDAVGGGKPYLLQEAQEQLRLNEATQRQAAETQMAILNALPAHIALLDTLGVILAVNESWRRFATANVLQSPEFCVGCNYLQICDDARGECSEEARIAAAGIRQVILGETRGFELEYPCHSPAEKRWFRLMVTPLSGDQRRGAVVMHVNITERRLAEESLRASEQHQRRLAQELTLETRRLQESQAVASVGSWETDLETLAVKWTDQTFRIFETSPDKFQPTHAGFLALVHPEDRAMVDEAFVRSIGKSGVFSIDHRLLLPEGHIKQVEERWQTFTDEGGRPSRATGTCQDITERKRAGDALRAAEAKYRSIFDNALEGIFQSTPEGRYITLNPAFARIHGYDSPEEMMGVCTDIGKQVYVKPEDRQEFKRRLAEAGEILDFQHQTYRKDRSTVWVSLNARVVRDSSNQPIRYEGSIVDITERKKAREEILQAAETLSAIVRVQNEIADNRGSLTETMTLIAERTRVLTRADGAVVEMVEGEEMVYSVCAGAVADKTGLRARIARSLSGLAASTGTVLCCHDTETDDRVDLTACRNLGIRSMILAPLRADGQVVGVLKVLSRQPHAFAQRDVSHLQILARSLGSVIQRQTGAEALRASAEEFRTLAEAMPQIVWMTRADGWNTYFNRNWMIYTGLSLEESLGHGWDKPFHPEDRQRAWEAWQRATSSAHSYSVEARLRRADGEYRWWLIRGDPLRDEHGQVLKWFGTCTDIHDLKCAAAEIVRANRALKMLTECNEALIHGEEEIALLREICRIIVSTGGYHMAWVGYTRHDARRDIEPMAHAGKEEGYLQEIQVTWSEDDPAGRGPGGRTIRTGEASVCEDIELDPGFHSLEAARQRGYRAVICLPLREGGRTFGLLGLYAAEVIHPGPEELKLLQELADDLAFGILTLRARAERQKLQEAVLAIAQGVSASVGDEFFQKLNQHTVQALRADMGFIALLDAPGSQSARTLAVVDKNNQVDNFAYSLSGSPCAEVARGQTCLVESEAQQRYPGDPILAGFKLEAGAGTPLLNSQGVAVGLIAVFFRRPIIQKEFVASTLQIFAARAASEMERRQADSRLREQAALLDAAHEGILVRDLEDKIVYWNKGAERLYGWNCLEVLGRLSRDLFHPDASIFQAARDKLFAEGKWEGEMEHLSKSGHLVHVQVSWTLILDAQASPKSILAINTDITEKKKLEAQFLRAQRMESLGTLAGGIAHDLNNILAPIMMSVGMLKSQAQNESDLALLGTLQACAQRGADLVGQVLSFAKGVEGQRITVNTAHLLRDLVRVMRETFPKPLVIKYAQPTKLWTVTGDPTQIHQVVLNLCVNARDAMPNGGELTIGVENIVLDDTYAGMNPESLPGPYVVIRVEDTGTGIPPGLRERIFEPFFTTKETGKGTGLGLSTTQAIVKSHGGFINLYSELGKGTRFKVYFPADATKEASEEQSIEQSGLPRGCGEVILVVDDEEAIRNIAQRTLERFGYRVVLASNGAEATSVYVQRKAEIAAVLTDMAMPIMDGPALIIALKAIHPSVRIIGSSGLTSNGGMAKAMGAGVRHFIPKPYTAEAMLKTLRTALDEPA